jgi:alkylhydroperoxidase family enzyme
LSSPDYLSSSVFNPRERAALLWAEHVARNTAGSRDDVAREVKAIFSDAELVELTFACGMFAANNRFQDSMLLPLEEQSHIERIKLSVRADPVKIRNYVKLLIDTWPQVFPAPEHGAPPVGDGPAAAAATAPAGPPRVPLVADNAALEQRRFLAAAEALLGGIPNFPNFVRIWAHIPYVAKFVLPFQVALEREGAGSILPSALKAMVLVETSRAHAAPYSMAHRTALARAAGVTAAQLTALRTGGYARSALFSARERAALDWAAHVAPNTAKRHQAVFDTLKQHCSEAEIVELTGVCAVASEIDLMQNALRVPLESPAEIAAINRDIRLDPARLKGYLETLLANWPDVFPEPLTPA